MKGLIHRLFTPSSQVIHRPAQLLADLEAVRQRVTRLEGIVKDLEASLDATDAALHKLRGQVHGPRGGRPRLITTAQDIPPGDKESLREYAGLRAGAIPKHEA